MSEGMSEWHREGIQERVSVTDVKLANTNIPEYKRGDIQKTKMLAVGATGQLWCRGAINKNTWSPYHNLYVTCCVLMVRHSNRNMLLRESPDSVLWHVLEFMSANRSTLLLSLFWLLVLLPLYGSVPCLSPAWSPAAAAVSSELALTNPRRSTCSAPNGRQTGVNHDLTREVKHAAPARSQIFPSGVESRRNGAGRWSVWTETWV